MAAPTFLGIGALKAATTTVAEYLKRHPEVYLAPKKELYWFDPINPASDMSQAEYEDHFDPQYAVRGEITPTYQDWWVLPRIARVYPGIKLILNVRPPIERLCSAIRHLHAHRPVGESGEDTIERIIERHKKRLSDQMSLGDYETAIKMARALEFDLHIISFHEIQTDQQAVWRKLTEFLGVSFYDPGCHLHEHHSDTAGYRPYSIPDKHLAYLDSVYEESNQYMLETYGIDLFRR